MSRITMKMCEDRLEAIHELAAKPFNPVITHTGRLLSDLKIAQENDTCWIVAESPGMGRTHIGYGRGTREVYLELGMILASFSAMERFN